MNQGYLENYIKADESLCREERQYALYLHNYLKSLIGKRGEAEGIIEVLVGSGNATTGDMNPRKLAIENVFYEVTFMRDFYKKDKEDKLGIRFNELLMRFLRDYGCQNENSKEYELWKKVNQQAEKLLDRIKDIEDYNLGASKGQRKIQELLGEDDCKEIKGVLRGLMNSKPDIAVIYSEDNSTNEAAGSPHKKRDGRAEIAVGEKSLQFLECKYLSKVGSFDNGLTQKDYQDLISEFMRYTKCIDKAYETRVIRFVREADENNAKADIISKEMNEKCEYEIDVNALISKENALFAINN